MWRTTVALNLALLALFPASWLAPLARAAFWPFFFSANEISILSGIRDLWASDAALAALVALFAIVIPYLKTLALAAIHFRLLGPRALPAIEVIGKLSMTDVFLVALYIVVVKGVGVGTVSSAWGLWLFTGCVLASIWVAHVTRRHLAATG
ncbi:MAG TPA: paraquat-inducible protein A [Thermohalobaculum sp.]|nr:paraquat-inducible protein A [Thermohalobaculum sp.]